MEELSADVAVGQEKPVEKMECDEVLSGSESAELTETSNSSDKATGAEEKPDPSPVVSEPTSGIEAGSRSTTSTSEIPCEGVAISDVIEKTEDQKAEDQTTDSTGMSPPAKKTLLGNIKEFFSPPKDPKSLKDKSGTKSKTSRSKSMSPSKKAPQPAVGDDSNPVEEVCAASEGEEEHLKKAGEKIGVMKSIKRHLSKIMIRGKSSASESTNLVSDEETELTEASATNVTKTEEAPTEAAGDDDQSESRPHWTENRQSLTEKPSLDVTTMTDVPSTSSGTDVFPSDASSKRSETGENTSEEAVGGSLVSSPDEHIADIQEDKDNENEALKTDDPSAEETPNAVIAENGPEKQCLEENAEMQENKDD